MAKNKRSNSNSVPRSSEEVLVTQKMLSHATAEIHHSIAELRSDMDARFAQVDSQFSKMGSHFSKIESMIHKVAAETSRMSVLMEAQRSENRIVLEGYGLLREQIKKINNS